MNSIGIITCIGFGVGILGTGLGGMIAFFLKNPSKKFLSVILGATSGMMLSIVCFDLLPESFERGTLYIGMGGIFTGVIMIIGLDEILSKTNLFQGESNGYHFVKTGILLGLGIAIHNFPEGLAIGSGFMATKELGIGISIVIALHNMPEGISMAAPMCIGGMSRIRIFLYTVFAGIPMGLGAFLGSLIGEISPNFIAFNLAFAGGTMLYITCGELIPKSHSFQFERISTIGLVLGFVLGLWITMKL